MQESTQELEQQWYAAHDRYDYAQSDRIARRIAAEFRTAASLATSDAEYTNLRVSARYWERAADSGSQ